jgi:crotonobetainyl-CoA:carnitine CoA-transferase CaiB-like acyl-CoA transferase
MVHKMDYEGQVIRIIGNPVKLSDMGEEKFTPPPRLGQDTDWVLREILGYSPEEIQAVQGSS